MGGCGSKPATPNTFEPVPPASGGPSPAVGAPTPPAAEAKPTVSLPVASVERSASDTTATSEDGISPIIDEDTDRRFSTSVLVTPVLKVNDGKPTSGPAPVNLPVQKVLKKSKTQKLVAKAVASRASQKTVLRASGIAEGQGTVMSKQKSKRERERVATLKRSSSTTLSDPLTPGGPVSPPPTGSTVGEESVKEGAEGKEASLERQGAPAEASAGPNDLERFVGTWKGGEVKNRDEFLKAMDLPWVLRKVASMLPNFDMVFFIDEHGVLRSHANQMGKVVEEQYKEGGQSIKEFKGIKTIVTYHWEGNVLTYSVFKEANPEEEAKSRRWVEDDGVTMRAETHFRKNKAKDWVVLYRTWTRQS